MGTPKEKFERVSMTLPVKLTDAEMVMRGKAAAESARELYHLEQAAKDSAADFKEKVKAVEKEQKRLLGEVLSGEEDRLVECEVEYVVQEAKAVVRRLDTNKEVITRAMTRDELDAHRQGQLFAIEGGAADVAETGGQDA